MVKGENGKTIVEGASFNLQSAARRWMVGKFFFNGVRPKHLLRHGRKRISSINTATSAVSHENLALTVASAVEELNVRKIERIRKQQEETELLRRTLTATVIEVTIRQRTQRGLMA